MPDMKGITVKIPADLHAELKAYIEAHGMTTGEFIALAVDNELHPKIQIKEEQPMENMRTLAFQVPESLFQRVKAYLERNHMTQKQFVIGLIEAELEQDEAQYQAEHPEEQEDEEESDEQAEEETQDQLPAQEGQDGPDAGLEEQPADQENTAPVGDYEAGSEEVSQEDGWSEEQEEETQEDKEVEDTDIGEDNELGDAQEDEESWDSETSDEESQDEEEEQAYQPSMGW